MSHSWVFQVIVLEGVNAVHHLFFEKLISECPLLRNNPQSLLKAVPARIQATDVKKTRLFSKDLNCSTYGLKFNCVYLTLKSHAQWRKQKKTYLQHLAVITLSISVKLQIKKANCHLDFLFFDNNYCFSYQRKTKKFRHTFGCALYFVVI